MQTIKVNSTRSNISNARIGAMFPDKGTEYQAELIAANID